MMHLLFFAVTLLSGIGLAQEPSKKSEAKLSETKQCRILSLTETRSLPDKNMIWPVGEQPPIRIARSITAIGADEDLESPAKTYRLSLKTNLSDSNGSPLLFSDFKPLQQVTIRLDDKGEVIELVATRRPK